MSRPGGAARASQGRSERERRALNVVWTAAGEYGFVPEVLSFYRDGEPDIYMNLVVGLAHRYYDAGQLRSYMRELDESLLRSVFIDILWQGIENAVYERELPVRPVLRELAQEHARRRLSDELDMSMQQRMLRSDIVHTLEAGRAHELLGEPTGILNPWDRRLYAALRYPGDIDTEGIIARTREVLRRFFVLRFRDVLRRRGYHISLGTWMNAWLRRLLPLRVQFEGDIEHIERPVLEEGGAVPGGGPEGLSWGRSAARTQRELDRLAEEYGPPLLPEGERELIEHEICRDGHALAQLYFAQGRRDSEARQANRAWYESQAARYHTSIRELRDRLRSLLAVYRQPLRLRSRHGELEAGAVWRALYAEDERVFRASQETSWADFQVTLLLDGSESRADQQALIASQAYAIARSLVLAGIEVQVVSFCSQRGFTILRRLKEFRSADCEGVFDYFARGWNRDGLALRAMPYLLGTEQEQLLLVLTDAHPSDELGLAVGQTTLTTGYRGDEAIADAAAGARELRRQGVKLVGLVNSVIAASITDDAARRIFGEDCARIDDIGSLAAVVGNLVGRQIGQAAY